MATVTTTISYPVEHSDEWEWTGEVRPVKCHEWYGSHYSSDVYQWSGAKESDTRYPIFRRVEKCAPKPEQWQPRPEWKLPDHCWVWRHRNYGWHISTVEPLPHPRGGYTANRVASDTVFHYLAMHGLDYSAFVPPPVDCVEVQQ